MLGSRWSLSSPVKDGKRFEDVPAARTSKLGHHPNRAESKGRRDCSRLPFSDDFALPRKPLPETGRYLKGAEAKILLPNTHRDSPPFSGVNSSIPLSGYHGQNGHEGHSTRVLAKTGHAFNSTATTDAGNTARSRRIWLTPFPVLELVIPRLGNRSRPDSWVDREADRASGDGAVGAGSGAESRERSGGPGLPISDWPTHPPSRRVFPFAW